MIRYISISASRRIPLVSIPVPFTHKTNHASHERSGKVLPLSYGALYDGVPRRLPRQTKLN